MQGRVLGGRTYLSFDVMRCMSTGSQPLYEVIRFLGALVAHLDIGKGGKRKNLILRMQTLLKLRSTCMYGRL
jgi:hypothetical protein